MTLYVDNVYLDLVDDDRSRYYDLSGLRFLNGCSYTLDGSYGNYKPTQFLNGFLYDFTAMNYWVEAT